uniref:NAD-dependent epimerase/dehydratase family protein n=1 Tax=Polynucleobacter sp. TaxID=2029855 RepID=UPI004048CCAC
MNIFLTGATGFVGGHLLKRLLAEGHHVLCHVRLPQAIKFMQANGAETWQGDLHNVSALSDAMCGIDSVIHCAAETNLWNSEALLNQTNVILTQQIIEAAKRANVKQFIYMSDASIAKDRTGTRLNVTETTPLPNYSDLPYTQSKSSAEQWVIQSGDETFRTVSLRPAFIWGKGDLIDQSLGKAADLKQFGWFSQGDYPFSSCYIQNLCEAVSKTLLSTVTQESFFIADDEVMSMRAWMTKRLMVGGYSVPTLSIPRSIAWPLARFTENGWRYLPLNGKPPLIREMVHLMANPFSVSINKAKKLLAYQAPYSIEEGMLAIANPPIH